MNNPHLRKFWQAQRGKAAKRQADLAAVQQLIAQGGKKKKRSKQRTTSAGRGRGPGRQFRSDDNNPAGGGGRKLKHLPSGSVGNRGQNYAAGGASGVSLRALQGKLSKGSGTKFPWQRFK